MRTFERGLVFLIIHAITLLALLGIVAHSYYMGLMWMLGKTPTLSNHKVTRFHFFAWRGIALMILSGIGAFFFHRNEYLDKWQFHVKMTFLVALIINCIAINRIIRQVGSKTFKELDKKTKLHIYVSATIATLCWAGVLLFATMIGVDE